MTPAQPRHPLAQLADYIEASRARDAAEATIRSGATGCSDFVRAVTRELDAREALMQLDPAALRVRVDIEADGMRAGLGGHAGTHNPYIWKGSPEHRDAWSRGQQAVEKFGRDRYQMGYEKAQEMAAVTGESTLRAQAEAEADRGLEVGWANRVRLDWDDFSAFSKVLFFALHSPGNRNKLQNFTELSDEQINQLVRLCEDYEQRAAALAQAGGEP